MNILYPLHVTGFDVMFYNEKKEAETVVEDIICAILYLENLCKSRFSDLNKCIENDYVLNEAEYLRTIAAVQILLLKYQHNYNYNSKSQSHGVRNQLMFIQRGKTMDYEGKTKEKKQKPEETLTNSPAMIVGVNSTMQETVNDPHKQISNSM